MESEENIKIIKRLQNEIRKLSETIYTLTSKLNNTEHNQMESNEIKDLKQEISKLYKLNYESVNYEKSLKVFANYYDRQK